MDKRELIWAKLTEMGMTIGIYEDCDADDVFVLEADSGNLASLASYLVMDDCAGMREVSALMSDARGVWYREEWLLARVGLTLGIIDRAEARAIAREWACEDAPDERVLPGFLLWE